MSGSISDGVALVASLFVGFGDGVALGSFVMTGLEIPEKMPFGGKQMKAIHTLLGGARVVDLLGYEPHDVTWSGYFSGPNASLRAQMVDNMCRSGQMVALSWPGDGRNVIVEDFKCDYAHGGYLLPYTISCLVIPDAPGYGIPSLLGQLGSDIASSLGITDSLKAVGAAISPVLATAQTAVQTIQAALPIGVALTGGSAAFSAVAGAVAGGNALLSGARSVADGNMSAVLSTARAAGNLFGGRDGASAATALGAAAIAAQGIAATVSVGGLVGRMAANVKGA